MFLLIIRVYFLRIIVVERIQVEFGRKVAFFPFNFWEKSTWRKHSRLTLLTTVPALITASSCPRFSLLKLHFITHFPHIQPFMTYSHDKQ